MPDFYQNHGRGRKIVLEVSACHFREESLQWPACARAATGKRGRKAREGLDAHPRDRPDVPLPFSRRICDLPATHGSGKRLRRLESTPRCQRARCVYRDRNRWTSGQRPRRCMRDHTRRHAAITARLGRTRAASPASRPLLEHPTGSQVSGWSQPVRRSPTSCGS
jgi:hypothetical protein